MKYRTLSLLAITLPAWLLSGCITEDDSVVIEGDVAIAYVKRPVDSLGNPVDSFMFTPGGDLYIRDYASPSAKEKNITRSYTGGEGDVSDPEVSYDGSKILFSMRGPDDPSWNIWEYDISESSLNRIIEDDTEANAGDDVDPTYLPDGRIIFSSNRQEKSRKLLAAENIEPYAYRDEYERERTIVLHTMNHDGTGIEQISFNQSHDRNPTVLSTGEVMFSRWDHLGGRNHFPIFFTDPGGTNTFVLYGAFSPGNSFLHPRELPDGRVISSLMPLLRTHEGGALVIIDIKNFSENDIPAPSSGASGEGQYQPTLHEVEIGRGISEYGRFSTPYPLWDGTNRVLTSWSPSQPERQLNELTQEMEDVEGVPVYGVYMLDLDDQSMRAVVLAPQGYSVLDPVAIQARPQPNIISSKVLSEELAGEENGLGGQGMAILNVKSVYDTDSQDLMGNSMLVGDEVIPTVAPAQPEADNRTQVADIATLKELPGDLRPARMIRVSRAVPTPPGISREAIGATNFEMQQILGYAEVEPDGSFRIKAPADMPVAVSVLDAEGRAIQTHTNWIQARAGETRTCNGCHSPRRGSALNLNFSDGGAINQGGSHTGANIGESMAETRTRLDESQVYLNPDPTAADSWSPEAERDPIHISYEGLPEDERPQNGFINYQEHIQPIWDRNCVACHDNNDEADAESAGLDLSNAIAGTGRLISYEEIMVGDPLIDEDTGLPIIDIVEDTLVIRREPALINLGGSRNSSRTSHLIERIYEQELRAGQDLPSAGVDHSAMLNDSERRVINEWVDLGAQYMNDPFGPDEDGDGVRELTEFRAIARGLDEEVFNEQIHPILMDLCSGCHRPFEGVGDSSEPANDNFLNNRFVLTGNEEGDFNVTVSMVTNTSDPDQSYLLMLPGNTLSDNPPHPHIEPATNLGIPQPYLPVQSVEYGVLHDWIEAANNTP